MTISKFEVDYCMNVILYNNAIMQEKFGEYLHPLCIWNCHYNVCKYQYNYGCKTVWMLFE